MTAEQKAKADLEIAYDPAPNPMLAQPGESAYLYQVNERWYVVIDGEDRGMDVLVLDLQKMRYVYLTWQDCYGRDGSRYLACECPDYRFNRKLDRIEQECDHYKAWSFYFNDYIYEPPEL